MFAIIGIVVVFGAVIAGFLMEHGHLAVLIQPAEVVTIGGAAVGTLLIANPMHVIKAIVSSALGVLGSSKFGKDRYLSTLKMMYEFFNKIRKEGLIAAEMDVEKPAESEIFKKYPEFIKDHHVQHFVCDTMRMAITGGIEPFDMDQMMELDMEVHHHEAVTPIGALSTVADALPGLGIVAAVLGVVITMGALEGPPKEIGEKVAAALVGTFPRHPHVLRRRRTPRRQHDQGLRRTQLLPPRPACHPARLPQGLRPHPRHRDGTPRHPRPHPPHLRRDGEKLQRTSRTRSRPLERLPEPCHSEHSEEPPYFASALCLRITATEPQRYGPCLTQPTSGPSSSSRKKGGHGGHHGGAWKVAYADFVTAMMSLFIVLWLLNSTPQVKKSVAGYFNDPKGSGSSSGSSASGTSEAVSITKTNVEKLKEEIQKAILDQPELKKLNKQVEMTIMGEGLKIELIEDKGGTFFDSGSAKLSESGVALMAMLAGQLKVLPNSISIEGHTDAQPYASENGYSNWELSTDRANSARRLLQEDGVGEKQVSQVRGFADQQLRVPANPLDPSNRRISLIVSWEMAPEAPPSRPKAKRARPRKAHPKKAQPRKPSPRSPPKAKPPQRRPQKSAKDKPSAGVTADGKPLPASEAAPAAKPVEARPAAPVKLSLMDRIKAMLPGKKTKPADARPAEAAKPEVSAKTEGEPRPAAEANPSSEGSAPAEGGKPVAPADANLPPLHRHRSRKNRNGRNHG